MPVEDSTNAKHYRWAELPAERLKGGLTRRLITGERMMIAHVHFARKAMTCLGIRTRTNKSPTFSRAR